MPNSIISYNQKDKELFNAITSFFSTFKIGNLLRKCNAQKEKGVPVLDIFKYKLCNVFPTGVCICSRRQDLTGKSSQKTLFTGL